MIVAIDGPAGAGKSTVSRELARRLGYVYVDTGAMYRVVGVLARERGDRSGRRARPSASSPAACGSASTPQPDGSQRVIVDGRDVTKAIRGQDVGEWASKVSARPEVRERLVALQRALGRDGGVVVEGRDIGTVVFPDAEAKFFLEAAPRERAPAALAGASRERRRGRARRDRRRDRGARRAGPLARATRRSGRPPTRNLDSTALPVEDVIDLMLARVSGKAICP